MSEKENVTTGSWLIRNATLPDGRRTDLLLRDGTIAQTGPRLSADGAQVLDAGGLLALPGLVDLHTHLREPGREDAETVETGTAAAALGGFTAVHAMANTDPVADTAGVVEQIWRLGRRAGRCGLPAGGGGTTAPGGGRAYRGAGRGARPRRRPAVGRGAYGAGRSRLAELGAMADSPARVRIF